MTIANLDFKKINKIYYLIILSIFSFFINQYYGYIGVSPLDNFFSFNLGYDILNGHYPFKDYWTITGPLIGFFQALLFKMFGVSWSSYILQASIFNFIISISTFYVLYKFKLNKEYCFFYSILLSIIAYPSVGTPYVDHQSAYLCIISIYVFILALKTKSKFYWFILPAVLIMAFLTKQAPTGYFILIIAFLSIIYFIFNFNLEKFFSGFLGLIVAGSIFASILIVFEIPFLSFFQQYILYPLSIGGSRTDLLFPLEFTRIILRFKLIHLSLLILLIVSIKGILKGYKYLKSDEFMITLSLISSAFALIIHQLMTINGMFIFFIIPILTGFSHVYFLRYFKSKKYILYLLIFLSLASTVHYWNKYINKRDFIDLSKANIATAIDAKILDKKLNGLKWITLGYMENPKKEISYLKEAMNIIKNDNKVKTIVTDYQFISVAMSLYDNSPNAYWFKHHVYPEKGHKHFAIYKKFFISKLKENKIKVVYTVKPLSGDDDVLDEILNKNCVKKISITKILDSHLLLDCEDLRRK